MWPFKKKNPADGHPDFPLRILERTYADGHVEYVVQKYYNKYGSDWYSWWTEGWDSNKESACRRLAKLKAAHLAGVKTGERVVTCGQ